ncbi:MAG: hypothetical protein DMG43_09455 [Acidobacteria bacterium]|nr:MAG: hypothetical protein DMG43_09455 [Acidobacteriota bacterium]
MDFTQSELHLLAARVEKLEAQNRRWKLAGVFFALSGVSLVLMAAKPADRIEPPVVRAGTVEAQEFILKDTDGHVYARLSLGRALAVKQPNGTYFIPYKPVAGQAALQFFDDKGDVLWTAPTKAEFMPAK